MRQVISNLQKILTRLSTGEIRVKNLSDLSIKEAILADRGRLTDIRDKVSGLCTTDMEIEDQFSKIISLLLELQTINAQAQTNFIEVFSQEASYLFLGKRSEPSIFQCAEKEGCPKMIIGPIKSKVTGLITSSYDSIVCANKVKALVRKRSPESVDPEEGSFSADDRDLSPGENTLKKIADLYALCSGDRDAFLEASKEDINSFTPEVIQRKAEYLKPKRYKPYFDAFRQAIAKNDSGYLSANPSFKLLPEDFKKAVHTVVDSKWDSEKKYESIRKHITALLTPEFIEDKLPTLPTVTEVCCKAIPEFVTLRDSITWLLETYKRKAGTHPQKISLIDSTASELRDSSSIHDILKHLSDIDIGNTSIFRETFKAAFSSLDKERPNHLKLAKAVKNIITPASLEQLVTDIREALCTDGGSDVRAPKGFLQAHKTSCHIPSLSSLQAKLSAATQRSPDAEGAEVSEAAKPYSKAP